MPKRKAVAGDSDQEQDILDREDVSFRLSRIVAAINEEVIAEELLRKAHHELMRAKRTLREATMRRRLLAAQERRKSASR